MSEETYDIQFGSEGLHIIPVGKESTLGLGARFLLLKHFPGGDQDDEQIVSILPDCLEDPSSSTPPSLIIQAEQGDKNEDYSSSFISWVSDMLANLKAGIGVLHSLMSNDICPGCWQSCAGLSSVLLGWHILDQQAGPGLRSSLPQVQPGG